MDIRLIFLRFGVRLKQRDGFLSSAGRLEMSGPLGALLGAEVPRKAVRGQSPVPY